MSANFEATRKNYKGLAVSMFILALVMMSLTLLWSSTAFAQTTPFESQYSEPPAAPPTAAPETPDEPSAQSSSSAAGNAAGDTGTLSEDNDDVVSMLPTTGGIPFAPLLLGGAVVAGAGVLATRRLRR